MAGERQVSLDGRWALVTGAANASAPSSRARCTQPGPTSRSTTTARRRRPSARRRAESRPREVCFHGGRRLARHPSRRRHGSSEYSSTSARPARRARQQRLEFLSHADRHDHARAMGRSVRQQSQSAAVPVPGARAGVPRRARRHRQHRRRAFAAAAARPSRLRSRPKPGSRC